MAIVKPFTALRFQCEKAGSMDGLCCPPYDIIPDPAPWLERSPYNIIRLEGGERLKLESDPYESAASLLAQWEREGVLVQDEQPAFYLYDIEFAMRDGTAQSLWGWFAHVELRPWADGVVKPHEHTLSAAKEDRRRLMSATGCHFSPVYSLHRDPGGAIAALTQTVRDAAPLCDFQGGDGLRHRLWMTADAAFCDQLSGAFDALPLYIADGHHRYETSLRMREEMGDSASPYILMFLCPDDHAGLEVHATHRLVLDLPEYDENALRMRLSEMFTLTPDNAPKPGEPLWVAQSGEYRLTPKSGAFAGLDVSLLHDQILEPLFGIDKENMAAGRNLRYTRDEDEARAMVARGEAQCAFFPAPTRVQQILDTADAGGVMPQKSTYFYPKLMTGLVINRFRTGG